MLVLLGSRSNLRREWASISEGRRELAVKLRAPDAAFLV